MELTTLSSIVPTGTAPTGAADHEGIGPSLFDSARVEFHASLQLLAERVLFLTAASGVAIALKEGDKAVYSGVAGTSAIELDMPVDSQDKEVEQCLRDAVPVRTSSGGTQFRLLVPIKQDDVPVGLFEVGSKYEFSDEDVNAITRLADLAGVAFDHRKAAARADSRSWEEIENPQNHVLWHAPEVSECEPSAQMPIESSPVAQVRSCAGCGFPVSPGRTLCVECEQKSDIPMAAPAELFTLQNQPGWISEHGYTIASLIVTVLAAAIILWLRR